MVEGPNSTPATASSTRPVLTDAELLAKVAKVAGRLIEWGIVEGGRTLAPPTVAFCRHADGIRRKWNPLASDADAWLLAARLCLTVKMAEDLIWVTAGDRLAGPVVVCVHDLDTLKAARRAIVLAASALIDASAVVRPVETQHG